MFLSPSVNNHECFWGTLNEPKKRMIFTRQDGKKKERIGLLKHWGFADAPKVLNLLTNDKSRDNREARLIATLQDPMWPSCGMTSRDHQPFYQISTLLYTSNSYSWSTHCFWKQTVKAAWKQVSKETIQIDIWKWQPQLHSPLPFGLNKVIDWFRT